MNPDLKCALITGAAQRIGADITRQLHHLGFNVIIHYRQSGTAASDLAKSLNAIRDHSAVCLQADLTDIKQVQQLAINASNSWGRIDALVNNASDFYPTPLDQASEQDWSTLVDGNLKGPYFLCQALASTLRQNRGCIVNLVDIHSQTPLRDHSIYSIAKAGVAMMTKSLAREMAPDVRVNGISPGAILWPQQQLDEQARASIVSKIPLQRTGEPNDIATTTAFLICQAPYISGQIIAVDGGRSLNM